MSLIVSLIGFLLIKSIIWLPFYFKQWKACLLVVLCTSLAVVPLMKILYHETAVEYTWVYVGIILLDILAAVFLVQRNWWKAVAAALLANTFAIVFFFLGNG